MKILIFLFGGIIAVIGLISFGIGTMDESDIIQGIGIFVLVGGLIMVFSGFHELGYKDGQIDCIRGKVQYELITKEDSTRTWERITEETDK